MEALLVVVAVALVLGGAGTLVLLAYRRRVSALTNALHEDRRRRQAELGNAAHPLTRIRAVKPVKFDRH